MSGILLVIGVVFAAIAAILHVYIFIMESVTWARPATWRRFGIASQSDADTVKPMALNQGFYNLFLAVTTIVGLILLAGTQPQAGLALAFVGVGSMLAAALVLVVSNPRLARAAVTQGVTPLIAICFLAIGAATA